jgi:tyrosyl-tRNA synthetase
VWLDPKRTSPYKFYQFWINTDDNDAERLLKLFTFLPLEEIAAIMAGHDKNPGARAAQRRLAFETTSIVHGGETAENVAAASEVLFGSKSLAGIGEETLAMLKDEVPFSTLGTMADGMTAVEVLTACGACESKGEAKRSIKQGAVSINELRLDDEGYVITRDNLLHGKYIFIRVGKKNFHLAQMD